jgi:vanillate O-demethylase monooxygenase subunit
MFLRNYWYVAAWSSELSSEPLARMILNEPIALFRGPKGQAVALQDRCAHRRMPLSKGKIVGETLICCYHGLTYDFSGNCIRVPGESQRPTNIRVRSFPAVERYGAVWLWMGDPAQADATKIFRCDRVDTNGGGQPFYFHVKANYLYINDNLSDLLHQAYLHNPSFGGNTRALGETIPSMRQHGDRIEVNWDWINVPPPGTLAEVGGIKGLADGWNHSAYEPPCFYVNYFGFAATGSGGSKSTLPDGAGRIIYTIYQLITPETPRSTHFFKIVACDWPTELLPKLSVIMNKVNLEDIWAIEEQQKMEDINPAAPMQAIPTDGPVVRMRSIVQRLYNEEQCNPAESTRA